MNSNNDQTQQGRRAALVIAGTAVLWAIATYVGGQMGLSNRVRALFDLMALAGFIWAFWMIFQIWRARQDN